MSDLRPLLTEKDSCEAEVMRRPEDHAAISRYLGTLQAINRQANGIVSFRWPSVTNPLYFRAGSTDFLNFSQIFRDKEYGFELPFSPRRILDLGAYVGFAAVFFAERFRQAEIVCLEPSRENFKMLMLNVGAYANVKVINAAIWDAPVEGGLTINNFQGGDWGTNFSEKPAFVDADVHTVRAVSLAGIMSEVGWARIDFLKCDIEGGEKRVFEHARDLISAMVDVCAVEIHEQAVPGSRTAVSACFDDATFASQSSGEFDVFIRKTSPSTEQHPIRHDILRPNGYLNQVTLTNVRTELWAYYIFDGCSCQLHPAESHQSPAEMSFEVCLDGQCRFETGLSVLNPLGYAVEFMFALTLAGGGEAVAAGNRVVSANTSDRLEIAMNPLKGAYRVSLRTRMAAGCPTSHQAVANWEKPAFR